MESKDSIKEKSNPADTGIPTGPMAAFDKDIAAQWLKEPNITGIRVLEVEGEGEVMQRLRRDTNQFKYKVKPKFKK